MQRHRPNCARGGNNAPILQRLQALRLGRARRMAAATAMPVRAREEREEAARAVRARTAAEEEEEEEEESGEESDEEDEEGEELGEEDAATLDMVEDLMFSGEKDKVVADHVDGNDVQMLVLGFDGTLTMVGYVDPVAMKRVEMTSRKYADFRLKTPEQHVLNFGGEAQIKALHELFERLQDFDVELRILSLGTKKAIMYALGLPKVDLLKYFSDDQAGKDGARIWGGDTPPLSDDKAYKGVVIEEWMQERGLQWDEVVVVDDDSVNIDMPEKGSRNPGIAKSLHPGHAILHDYTTLFMDNTLRRVEELCGLVDLEAEEEAAAAK
jgi:hypothetical protein